MTEKPPPIDLSLIPFPTDKITFGELRRNDSEYCDSFEPEVAYAGQNWEFEPDFFILNSLLSYERKYADTVYLEALGLPTPHDIDPSEAPIDLLKDYESFGLASGPSQAAQFIRDIRSAALKQAQKHLGKQI